LKRKHGFFECNKMLSWWLLREVVSHKGRKGYAKSAKRDTPLASLARPLRPLREILDERVKTCFLANSKLKQLRNKRSIY